MGKRAPKDDGIKRCPKCGAGPLGNCGFYGCETPRETCPIIRTATPTK